MGLARLLVAAATWRGGHELVHMSKAWRSDVSSFYTTNGPQNAELRRESGPLNTTEVWYEHRDHVAAECDGCVGFARGTEPPFQCPNTEFANHCGWCGNGGGPNAPACRFHEQRYVLTPSLANQTLFPDYDWLLYADAETVWFSDHVRTMLAGVDPDQPWYFSESMFPDSNSNCVFPGRKAIRKDGCVWSPAPSPLCTPATIISPDNCAWSAAPDKDGGANPRPPGQVWNGGNWGLIISRGLMARVTPDQWLDCVTCAPDFHGCYGGGDCRVGECLWRHGVAPTLPDHDYGAAGGQRMGTGSLVVDSYTSFLENVSAAGGGCDGACRLEVERPLTANIEGGEPQMRRLERAYAAVVDGPAGLRREWRAAGGG